MVPALPFFEEVEKYSVSSSQLSPWELGLPGVFRHTLHKEVDWMTAFNWFLLSFLAGNVNAGGFLACERFVTHVTGFATLFGVDAARGRWDAAGGILSVPIYFLGGVMLSAYLIDRPVHRGRKPHYALVMGLVAICLAVVAIVGWLEGFGKFGEVSKLRQDYLMLVLLCGASGLQNAAISTSSGATVRTTHLTGMTTDLGISIVRALAHPKNSEARRSEFKASELRVGSIVSFGVGSVVGAFLFLKIQYLGFLLPAGIAVYAMFVALLTTNTEPVRKAVA
jgi:uncharacterized membrane protein YoaK (UPF0700 family)